jgi:hypothetical protein
MGKIILVPAQVQMQRISGQYGSTLTGAHKTYPVMLHGDDANRMFADVTIPEPQVELYLEDNLPRYSSYFMMGRLGVSNRKQPTGSWMGCSVPKEQLGHAFWDHLELETLVEPLKGDVLVQVGDDTWHIHATHPDDSAIIPTIFHRTKKFKFQILNHWQRRDRVDEIIEWVRLHTTDFDADKDRGVVYIRDETEATHFKLKWVGPDEVAGP